MKTRSFALLLLFLSGLGTACTKRENGCTDDRLKSYIACEQSYEPVCGCDGVTYPNACIAKFHHGIKYFTPGDCDCTYSTKGRVEDLTGLDGCSKVIRVNDSTRYEVVSLPPGFTLNTDALVEFDYREVQGGSVCMVGKMIEITCIREYGCRPVVRIAALDMDTAYNDPVTISQAEIKGNCLEITYHYGGGCHNDHEVRLVEVMPWCGTPPLQLPDLLLQHRTPGDLCQAWITKTAVFDLSYLETSSSGSVTFTLRDPGMNFSQSFTYTY